MTGHTITTDCPRCELYAMSRGDVIRAEIAKTSSGAEAERRWREFLASVHHRHLTQEERLLWAIFGQVNERLDEALAEQAAKLEKADR